MVFLTRIFVFLCATANDMTPSNPICRTTSNLADDKPMSFGHSTIIEDDSFSPDEDSQV